MTILHQIHQLVNEQNLTIEQAVEQVIPGADVSLWERRLANYDPSTPPKKRTKRARRTRKTSKRTFRASQVLAKITLSGAEKQAKKRAEAMAEQVERVNNRSILVNVGSEFYGVMEVAG